MVVYKSVQVQEYVHVNSVKKEHWFCAYRLVGPTPAVRANANLNGTGPGIPIAEDAKRCQL